MVECEGDFLARRDGEFDATPASRARFRRLVYDYFRRYGRALPWRETTDPYRILVSEIMLQQTQVERAVEKYRRFVLAFPGFESLARARLRDVLALWRGLGYNRRAAALKAIAEQVVTHHGGALPGDEEALVRLPGIGRATANAVRAYAFNAPAVFIETNVRAVFLHYFFRGRDGVGDAELLPIVAGALDRRRPRMWYSALMDLGGAVKRRFGNPARRSAHHRTQAPFEGSRRQIRGRILEALLQASSLRFDLLTKAAGARDTVVRDVLRELAEEGLVRRRGRGFGIP